jgi:ketosteroid isomerase-like protein
MKDDAAIRAVSAAWKEAFNAGNAAAVVSLYAEDAVLAAPGAPALRGKASISAYFARTVAEFKSAGLTVADAPLGEIVASGDLGFQWMIYRISDPSGAVVDAGKLLTLFQRRDGKWTILGDVWNSDIAPAGPAASVAGSASTAS